MRIANYSSIILFFILCGISIHSQGQQMLYYNATGQGVQSAGEATYYRTIFYDSTDNTVDSVHDYYINQSLRLRGKVLQVDANDDRNTLWTGRRLMYYRSGRLAADDYYNKSGQLDSVCTRYYESGKKKQLLVLKNGAVADKFYKEWDELGNCEKDFSDHFKYDNNKNGWPVNTNDRHASRIIKDSGLEMVTSTDNSFMQSLYLPIDQSKNYSIETVVQQEWGDNNLFHGLVWGFQDWSNYFFFIISSDGHYSIGAMHDGVVIYTVKNGTNAPIKTEKNANNLLKIVKENRNMNYCINGQLIHQTKSYAFTGNYAGFLVAGGKQQSIFKRIIVRQSITDESDYTGPGSSPNDSLADEFKGWKGEGSGFFIDASGYILTNYHVIKDANKIEVDATQDGDRNFYKAEVVAKDKQNDLALLKITDANFKPYPTLPYNFNTTPVDVASYVFALGFPLAQIMGIEIKFTDGKISSETGINGSPEEYQITVPIQPGNSGGPLFDNDGNIVGITNSKIESNIVTNVAYAIKSSYVKSFLDAFPKKLALPSDKSIANKKLTDKIKILTDYVVLIKVR